MMMMITTIALLLLEMCIGVCCVVCCVCGKLPEESE